MRAFMSRIRHIERLAWNAGTGFVPLTTLAEREARRILAETEPASEPEHWFGEKYRRTGVDTVAAVTAYRTFAQMRAGNTAEPLADALRAWLGEGE